MALLDPLEPERVRPPGALRRRAISLAASAGLHAAALAWVALGPVQEAGTLYEQAIAPYRDRIVWYNLRDKLPEVSPAEAETHGPPKTEVKRTQTMVSSAPDRRKGDQTIWLPEPAAEAEAGLPSPNLLAFSRPETRPTRAFEAPAERAPAREAELPDAPETTAEIRPLEGALPGPARPTREFVVPARRARRAADALPDAPELAASVAPASSGLPQPARPRPRPFAPPPAPIPVRGAAELPAAPEMAVVSLRPAPGALPGPAAHPTRELIAAPRATRTAAALPAAPELAATATAAPVGLPGPARPRPRLFAPPARPAPIGGAAELPAAPEVAATPIQPMPWNVPGPASRPTREFAGTPRAARPAAKLLEAPEPGATATSAPAGLPSAAIVGLNPAPTMEVPRPAGSRRVEFSAGPQPRAGPGGGGSAPGALIRVPGLLVRDGARDAEPTLVARVIEPATSARNLAAAARSAPPKTAAEPETPERAQAVRVSSAPDPRLEGRIVYSIAVQMPNVTSYSGSWILWFAERQQQGGAAPDMRAPLPLRKVDPKYFPAAMDERVEGRVRLAAVIRRTGRVEAVALLQGLDPRLDRSAEDALGKWEFEPALRNGVPVDVDAVVEIPFRLAPRKLK